MSIDINKLVELQSNYNIIFLQKRMSLFLNKIKTYIEDVTGDYIPIEYNIDDKTKLSDIYLNYYDYSISISEHSYYLLFVNDGFDNDYSYGERFKNDIVFNLHKDNKYITSFKFEDLKNVLFLNLWKDLTKKI